MIPYLPENIMFHELTGLFLTVSESTDKTLIGRSGIIVDETKNLLRVKSLSGNLFSLPKSIVELKVHLPGSGSLSLNGALLTNRPEDRTLKMRYNK